MPKIDPASSIHYYVRANPSHDVPGAMLTCPRCRMKQPIAEFYITAARRRHAEQGTSRGANPQCRTCNRTTNTDYRAERVAIIEAAKAPGCVDCGMVNLEHPEIFDFDHVLPGKVKTITGWLTSGTVEDLRAEMARCEVVCSNCHRIRTKARPHGKIGSDKR